MRKTTALMAAAVVSVSFGLTVSQPAEAGDCLSTPVTYTPKPDVSQFKQRILHIKNQAEKAESQGWLDAAQASKFKSEYERLTKLEQAAGPKASNAKKDELEKDLTQVHQELHSTIAENQQKTS